MDATGCRAVGGQLRLAKLQPLPQHPRAAFQKVRGSPSALQGSEKFAIPPLDILVLAAFITAHGDFKVDQRADVPRDRFIRRFRR